MDRRGGGMGPMMPFFPGGSLGEQPPSISNPDIPPFQHMRERFPNAVWGPESQGQWGAFHPPGLAPPQMGPPAHPSHQFNQFEPRQAVFNFAGSGASPVAAGATPVSQFNSGYNGQYNGSAETASGYVPQGHFSPQATPGTVPFNSGPPNGFISHGQGNGVMGGTAPHTHPHPYPQANEYTHHQQQTHHIQSQQPQQQQNHQQVLFKSPLPSPAVSAPEASPVQAGFAMAPMSSPHGTSSMPNDQSSAVATVHTSVPCRVPTYHGSECNSTPVPQASPHTPIATSSSNQNVNSNTGTCSMTSSGGTTVQSRLKNMIMSRQGSNGSQGSAFSPGPGLTDSPPLGELRFSGSVAAVTSVASSPDTSQVQESFKMAQNFLAYRTTEPDPGSVVHHTSDGEKGDVGDLNQVSDIKKGLLSTINTYNETTESDQQIPFVSECQQLKEDQCQVNSKKTDESEINYEENALNQSQQEKSLHSPCDNLENKQPFKQPEEALEELFKGTEEHEIEKILTGSEPPDLTNPTLGCDNTVQTDQKTELPDKKLIEGSSETIEEAEPETEGSAALSAVATNQNILEISTLASTCPVVSLSSQSSFAHMNSPMITTSITSSAAVATANTDTCNVSLPIDTRSLAVNQDKSSNLSVYDFPDSPDQQQSSTSSRCSGFRLGRVRGSMAHCTTTTSAHQRLTCASTSTNASTLLRLQLPQDCVEGLASGEDGTSHPKTGDPSCTSASPLPFPSPASSAPAKSPRNECSTSFHNPITQVLGQDTTVSHFSNSSTIPPSTTSQSALDHTQPLSSSQILSSLSSMVQPESIPLSSSQSSIVTTTCSSSIAQFTSLDQHSSLSSCHPIKFSNQMQHTSQDPSELSKCVGTQSRHAMAQCLTQSVCLPYNSAHQSQGISYPSTKLIQQSSQSQLNQSSQNIQYLHTSENSIQPQLNSQAANIPYHFQNMMHSSSQQMLYPHPQNMPLLSQQSLYHPSSQSSLQPHQSGNQSSVLNMSHSSPQSLPHQSPQAVHPSPQSIPHQSPQAMSHASPQSLALQSPQTRLHASPQTAPHPSPHPSPQSMPHPSSQNLSHPNPQSVLHPSSQNMPHPSQNIAHSSGQPVPHASPQAVPHASPQNVSQTSPQSVTQASPQSVMHPSPQNVPHTSPHTSQNMGPSSSQGRPVPSPQNISQHSPQNTPTSIHSMHPPSSQPVLHHSSQNLGHPNPSMHHSGPNMHHSAPQLLSHSMPQNTHSYPNPYHYSYQHMNQAFSHQFHPHHIHPQMHMLHSNQSIPPLNACQHPIKNIANLAMPPNMIQPCLQPEGIPSKTPAKKAPAKRQPRKRTGPTKKQKQQQEKQKKEELEKLRLQEMQQEKQQKEEMEKLRFQEQQQQQYQHTQLQPFMTNKGPQIFSPSSVGGNQDMVQQEFLSQQWNQRLTLSQFHPQPKAQNPQILQPPPTTPAKASSKSQGSKSKKKSQPTVASLQQQNNMKDTKYPVQDSNINSVSPFSQEMLLNASNPYGQQYVQTQQVNRNDPSNVPPQIPVVNQTPVKGKPSSMTHLQEFSMHPAQQLYPMCKPQPGNHVHNQPPVFNHQQMMSPNLINSTDNEGPQQVMQQNHTIMNSQSMNQNLLLQQHPHPTQMQQTASQDKATTDVMLNFSQSASLENSQTQTKNESSPRTVPTNCAENPYLNPNVPEKVDVSNFPEANPHEGLVKTNSEMIPYNCMAQNYQSQNLNEIKQENLQVNSQVSNICHDSVNPEHQVTLNPSPSLQTSLTCPNSFSSEPEQQNVHDLAQQQQLTRPPSNPFTASTLVNSPPASTSTLLTINTAALTSVTSTDIPQLTAASDVETQTVQPIKQEIKPEPLPQRTNDEELKQRIRANELFVPRCSCSLPPGTQDPGPIYTHLGAGATLIEVRKQIEEKTGYVGAAIRVEKVLFTGKEGKTESGCPLPKWVIRRSGPEEKVLVVAKHRTHHVCSSSWIVVGIVAWEGMSQSIADDLYVTLVDKLNRYGTPTERRCGTNEDRTCVCQGVDPKSCGASFSFGCSWSMYYNMCKFARSKHTRKFKLTDEKAENEVEQKMQQLATEIAPVYQKLVPGAFNNQIALEDESLECRLGNLPGRPWTGVTACMDFCAHGHKDNHNMNNGCTVVATFTKHRGFTKPDDEQLHVLPLYVLDPTDECGRYESFNQKVSNGSLEVLNKYPCEIRLRSEPLLSCRARSLLARGLPLPNSYKNRGRSKAKPSGALAGLRRKSSEGGCSPQKRRKNDVKEVSDKLGLDVDFMLKSSDLEDSCDDFSKYSLEGDDYSWLLDFGNETIAANETERKKAGVVAEKESSDSNSVENKTNSENGLARLSEPNHSGKAAAVGAETSSGLPSSMPPPPSPARKRPFSPSGGSMSPFSSSQLPQHSASPSPTLSPLNSSFIQPCQPIAPPPSPHNSQSPVESSLNTSPSNFSSVSHFSPFSPQMPSLSPHGSSPSSPGRNVPPQNVPASNSTTPPSLHSAMSQNPQNINVLASTPGTLFGTSHNSPEMPRLSPHITLGSSSHGAVPKLSGEKPISGLALANQSEFPHNSMPALMKQTVRSESASDRVSSSTEPATYYGEDKRQFGASCPYPLPGRMGPSYGFANTNLQKTEFEERCKPFTYTSYSENMDNFQDPDIGGVAIALSHRSVLFEYAKHELHATTALKNPNRKDPKRLSLIFYHHKNLIYRNHGWCELEKKMEKKKLEVEKLAKEGKLKTPPSKKTKKNAKGGNCDTKNDAKIEFESEPPNGIKRIKFDNTDLQETHPPGMPVDHKNGHTLCNNPSIVQPPCNPSIPHHPDLISPPISYVNYSQTLPSFVDSNRPYSPAGQRNTSITPAFSISSKSPHLVTSQSPTLDQHSQKPIATPDHSYSSGSHVGHSAVPPFNTSLQEFNPYSTPGSSPYHQFSPYMDMQGNPNFGSYQTGNFFAKGPPMPMNYNTTTYVPQPFYGLTPPYSPGPQQPQQITHHAHHIQSQLPPGPFPHGVAPSAASAGALMSPYEDSLGRGPPAQPTTTWSQMRHVPSFHVHGPYAPWPGS